MAAKVPVYNASSAIEGAGIDLPAGCSNDALDG
jgi:hypothetical protein